MSTYRFDIALSFAGEQRKQVADVARYLTDAGVKVFYDEYQKADLWGKDLYQHLSTVYSTQARYSIIFASKEYAAKIWTTHELRSAQARALQEKGAEYILPVRFDATELPGIPSTLAYLDFHAEGSKGIADLVLEKLGMPLTSPPISISATSLLPAPSSSMPIGVAPVETSSSPRAYISSEHPKLDFFPVVQECNWGTEITLSFATRSSHDEAQYAQLRSVSSQIIVAFGFEVALATINSSNRHVKAGVSIWTFTFKPVVSTFEPQYEAGMGNLTAEKLAEMRVERLLLGSHPKRDSDMSNLLSMANSAMIESGICGLNTHTQVEECKFPMLWKVLKNDPVEFVEISWIVSIANLKLSSSVEHITSLSLKLSGSTLRVDFRGFRHRKYQNVSPHEINVHGDVRLSEH